MTRRPRDCRVAEWAELVGERVPEATPPDADRRARDGREGAGDEAR